MSYAAFWSGRPRGIRLMLPWAFLAAVLVVVAPQSKAQSTKTTSKPAPAPHPTAPAAHPSTYPGGTHPPTAQGTRPPTSNTNGAYQRPPSSNRPPSNTSNNGAYQRPPSTNTSQRPPTNQTGRPPSANTANTGHPSSQPPSASSNARKPQPTTNTAVRPNPNNPSEKGYRTVTSPDGRQTSVLGRDGVPTMTRVRTPEGGLRTTTRLPGGARVVESQHTVAGVGTVRYTSFSPARGVVERPVFGHPCCVRRSYLVGNRSYAVVYRGYSYRGFVYYRPVPAYIYTPAFYGWTTGVVVWGPPVAYAWGWGGQPWYVAYGPVFTPYPVYPSFDAWMTDYVISSNLQAAYAAGQADGLNAAQNPPPQITPEMKDQIAAEVQQDLQQQQQQAAVAQQASQQGADVAAVTNAPGDTPDALQAGHTLFRVVTPLNVKADGQDCVLNADDWVNRTSGLNNDGLVNVQVKASRSTDCREGAKTQIALADLMVMEGDFQEQVRNGVQYASTNMGQNGLPQGPDPGSQSIPLGTTVADANLSNTLQHQQQDADNDERNAMASSVQGGMF